MNRPLPPPPRPGKAAAAAQDWQVKPWDGSKTGEKIILYAETGMGKTTEASMAPDPVFIGLDDGGRKIKHPKTGKLLNRIEDAEGKGPQTFEAVRSALNACLTRDCKTVVIDTGTILESWAESYVLRTINGPRDQKCSNLEGFGYGKGYKHLYDAMRLPLLDCDRLIEVGKNVIVVCQSINNKKANPAGDDYLCNEPRLYHSRLYSVLLMWCEWADHIFRIDYQGTWVKKANKDAAYGKVSGDTTRVIQTKEETYYKAKSRTLDEPVIAFSTKDDDSLWQLLFNQGEGE